MYRCGLWAFLRPVAAVAVVTVTAGCVQQVGGVALPAGTTEADAGRSFGYADNRCGLLTDESVQATLDADDVVRPYSGAVCQFVLTREGAMIDVTFTWFDTGSLDRERALATDRGAQVSATTIERKPAFLARRGGTGAACAATAAAGGGVLSWWVQNRGATEMDTCTDAETLLSATLTSDM